MGEVRKGQKPGRKDLLGVNIAFPLKIRVLPPQIFFTDITAGIVSESKLSSKQYGFVEKRR